ncbi:hypothetical protein ACK3TF_001924 [Chlorella vulgaris]
MARRKIVAVPAAPAQLRRTRSSSRLVVVRAAELEEIDPMTGEVISGTSMAAEANERVQVGGNEWAFRSATVNSKLATPDKLPVVCLHGIGSSSYTYRNLLQLLGDAGHEAVAVDWLGHGASSKASYILGQYGMLYALENEDSVAKLVILNTPLALKTALRPELAAYKNPLPFLRPKPGAKFAGDLFNAAGGPYAMQYRDAQAYDAPYQQDPAASAAIAAIMERVDFPALLKRVDEGYLTWRKPSLLLFGSSDQFVPFKSVFEWLDSKRTSMKLASNVEAKLGHNPQEDYAEAIAKPILKFIEFGGEEA